MAWWWPFGRRGNGTDTRGEQPVGPGESPIVTQSDRDLDTDEPRGLAGLRPGPEGTGASLLRTVARPIAESGWSGPSLARDAGRFGHGRGFESFALRIINRHGAASDEPRHAFVRSLPTLMSYEPATGMPAPSAPAGGPTAVQRAEVPGQGSVQDAIAAAERSAAPTQRRSMGESDMERLRRIMAMHEAQGTGVAGRRPAPPAAPTRAAAGTTISRRAPATPADVPRSTPARRTRVTEGISRNEPPQLVLTTPPPAPDAAEGDEGSGAAPIERAVLPPPIRAQALPRTQSGGVSRDAQTGAADRTPARSSATAEVRETATLEPTADKDSGPTPSAGDAGASDTDEAIRRAIEAAERPAMRTTDDEPDDDRGIGAGPQTPRKDPPSTPGAPPSSPPPLARTSTEPPSVTGGDAGREVKNPTDPTGEATQATLSPGTSDEITPPGPPQMVLRERPSAVGGASDEPGESIAHDPTPNRNADATATRAPAMPAQPLQQASAHPGQSMRLPATPVPGPDTTTPARVRPGRAELPGITAPSLTLVERHSSPGRPDVRPDTAAGAPAVPADAASTGTPITIRRVPVDYSPAGEAASTDSAGAAHVERAQPVGTDPDMSAAAPQSTDRPGAQEVPDPARAVVEPVRETDTPATPVTLTLAGRVAAMSVEVHPEGEGAPSIPTGASPTTPVDSDASAVPPGPRATAAESLPTSEGRPEAVQPAAEQARTTSPSTAAQPPRTSVPQAAATPPAVLARTPAPPGNRREGRSLPLVQPVQPGQPSSTMRRGTESAVAPEPPRIGGSAGPATQPTVRTPKPVLGMQKSSPVTEHGADRRVESGIARTGFAASPAEVVMPTSTAPLARKETAASADIARPRLRVQPTPGPNQSPRLGAVLRRSTPVTGVSRVRAPASAEASSRAESMVDRVAGSGTPISPIPGVAAGQQTAMATLVRASSAADLEQPPPDTVEATSPARPMVAPGPSFARIAAAATTLHRLDAPMRLPGQGQPAYSDRVRERGLHPGTMSPLPVSSRMQRAPDAGGISQPDVSVAIQRAVSKGPELALVAPPRTGSESNTVQRVPESDIAVATDVSAVGGSKSAEAPFDIEKYLPRIADAVWNEFRRRLRSERERGRGRL